MAALKMQLSVHHRVSSAEQSVGPQARGSSSTAAAIFVRRLFIPGAGSQLPRQLPLGGVTRLLPATAGSITCLLPVASPSRCWRHCQLRWLGRPAHAALCPPSFQCRFWHSCGGGGAVRNTQWLNKWRWAGNRFPERF